MSVYCTVLNSGWTSLCCARRFHTFLQNPYPPSPGVPQVDTNVGRIVVRPGWTLLPAHVCPASLLIPTPPPSACVTPHPGVPQVDTNVGRIVVRLGWVPLEPLPEELQLHLLEQ